MSLNWQTKEPVFGLELLQIGILIGAFIIGLFVAFVFSSIFFKAFLKGQDQSQNLHSVRKRATLLGGLLFYLGAITLMGSIDTLPDIPHTRATMLLIWPIHFITVFLILLLVNPLIDAFFVVLLRHNQAGYGDRRALLSVLKGIIKIGTLSLLTVGLSHVFSIIKVDNLMTNLTIGFSSLTVVAGLASKDLLSNFFGALVIMVGRPFKIGDWIIVNKIEGRVAGIDIRATKLLTADGATIYVPNGIFTNKDITNYGDVSYQHISIPVSLFILSQDDLQDFLARIQTIISAYPSLITERSFWKANDIGSTKARLDFHLCFKTMSESEKVRHLHGFVTSIQEVIDQKGIAT